MDKHITNTSYGLDIDTKALIKYLFHNTDLQKGTLKDMWNEFHLSEPNRFIHQTADRLVLRARQNDEMAIEFIKEVSGSIDPMEERDETIKLYLTKAIIQVLADSIKNDSYHVYVREDFIPQTQGMTMKDNSEEIAETLIVWFQVAKIADLYLTRNFDCLLKISRSGVEGGFVDEDTGILAFKIEHKNGFKLHITNYGKTLDKHCQNVREIINAFQGNEMISDALVNAIVDSLEKA